MGIAWQSEYDTAVATAKENDKLVLAQFHSPY
ncbi:uncharacterized protein METZ01_LOCUS298097 [marine metagenome]|uniref:Uncharacterized protein n=1 Tax=marine metagenome TaxID=408172 RepID=A0A382M8G3_9ZZZZ